MSKKSSEYWKGRFLDLESASNAYGQDAFRQIEPAFDKAQREVQKQIEAWYGRFAKNNQITIQEAKKFLNSAELKEFKWDVEEYIKYGRENDLNQLWMKELENASAKFHISRLEALKVRTQQAAEIAFGNELDIVDTMARKVFTDDYYHTIYEVQKGFNLGWEIGQIDERKLEKLISKPWATDGKNFSDRIWQQRTQLVNEVHTQLTRTCLLGKAPDDAIKAISKKFDVSKGQAGRLVMTEQAYFHAVAQQEAFEDLDVEEFEIVATLDSLTSEICREMDGKHFPMKDYQPGTTAPPFHPWCRSVTVPFFDDEFNLGERAARDADGKTYYVPSDMKYKDWKMNYAEDATTRHYVTSSDKEQFKRYSSVLRELSPKTLAEFRKIKYNDKDKWEILKHRYRTVNRYEIDGDVPISKVIELDNAAWYTKQKGFDYSKFNSKTRQKLRKEISNGGNGATLEFDGKIYFSHSKFGIEGSFEHSLYNGEYPTVPLLEKRQFDVIPISEDDTVPRQYDTEAKFLEYVATKKNCDDVFTVTILSEKHICASCKGVVEQFKSKFPNSTVNIVSGKVGYNNSEYGLKTWKHRKKVK